MDPASLNGQERRGFHPRPLVFLHLPKTAGTTLWDVLSRQYPGGRGWRFTGARENLGAFRVMTPEERASYDLLTGHVHFGIHMYFEEPVTYITMLRDPVERVVSHYYHVLRHPNHYLYKLVTDRALTLHDYVERCITHEIDNDQVRWLLPLEHLDVVRGGVTGTMLAEAKRNIADYIAIAGLCERFDESLLLMKRTFGWEDVSYERRNVNSRRPEMGEVPAETIGLIRERCRHEVELYEFVRERLERRIAALGEGFRQDLEEFRTGAGGGDGSGGGAERERAAAGA